MKRLHVHVQVNDLVESRRFYTNLFGEEPTVSRHDYAKWLLDDPSVNFAISPTSSTPGIGHIGIQTDTSRELTELNERLSASGLSSLPQAAANCCYAVSDKHWLEDPSGVKWETFYTHGSTTVYGNDLAPKAQDQRAGGQCC